MKKFILVLPVFIIWFSSFSQTYTLSTKQVNLSGTNTADHYEGLVTLTNNSNKDTQFTWFKFEQQVQSGWTIQFCDPISCFDPIPSKNSFMLKAGKSTILSFKVMPNGKSGTGIFKVGLSLSDTTGPYDTITFNVNSWNTGIQSSLQRIPDFTIYPNPAKDEINIKYEGKGIYQIEILNLIGNRVKTYNQLEGDIRINISELPDGVYIIRLNDKGKIITRRISKS